MQDATFTLAFAATAGVSLLVVAGRLQVPSIVLLLLGGVVLGPSVTGIIDPSALGAALEAVTSLGVAIILFEGGLTLDVGGYKRAPIVIRRLLTTGTLVTWLGTAITAWLLFGVGLPMALMIGSLVIVTGPTVVLPLLRRLDLPEKVHHVLYWEGVLIDAVGVFVAVLCYEWLTPDDLHPTWGPLARFGLRIVTGVGLGLISGFGVAAILEREWVTREHANIVVLAGALATFAAGHTILHEAGILAVIVAGLVVAIKNPPYLKVVRRFKLQLTELAIGTLFILLAAQLDLRQFNDPRLAVLLIVIMFVLRPVAVAIATWGQGFATKERLMLSWIAPRGIVAAAMASLFALRLRELGRADAVYLEAVAYAVIGTTVTLQGLSAGWLARLLGLAKSDKKAWVFLGDDALVTGLAGALRRGGVATVELTDEEEFDDTSDLLDPRLAEAGAVMCVHTTTKANLESAQRFGIELAGEACYRWVVPDGDEPSANHVAGRGAWSAAPSPAVVSEGLDDGSFSIDVIELGEDDHTGRFGDHLRPLFWIDEHAAKIVEDVDNPGPPPGELAVVVRKRVAGLLDLIAHVELVDDEAATFEEVLRRLVTSAEREDPDTPMQQVVDGIIDRRETMPAAVGGGIAIPHGYHPSLEQGRCFLGVVPKGVSDMETPDDLPVRLVFLLVSPIDAASHHLESLAAIAALGQATDFVELLCRQRVPHRVAALIKERS